MKIAVKQKHIDKGETRSARCCPIALAVNERLHKKHYCYVNRFNIIIYDRNEDQRLSMRHDSFYADYMHPVRKFIRDFDNGNEVEPFEFDLNMRDELEKLLFRDQTCEN